ncbi:MAG: hypothetical protein ACLPN5_19975 [Roseiarcus sp.]
MDADAPVRIAGLPPSTAHSMPAFRPSGTAPVMKISQFDGQISSYGFANQFGRSVRDRTRSATSSRSRVLNRGPTSPSNYGFSHTSRFDRDGEAAKGNGGAKLSGRRSRFGARDRGKTAQPTFSARSRSE